MAALDRAVIRDAHQKLDPVARSGVRVAGFGDETVNDADGAELRRASVQHSCESDIGCCLFRVREVVGVVLPEHLPPDAGILKLEPIATHSDHYIPRLSYTIVVRRRVSEVKPPAAK